MLGLQYWVSLICCRLMALFLSHFQVFFVSWLFCRLLCSRSTLPVSEVSYTVRKGVEYQRSINQPTGNKRGSGVTIHIDSFMLLPLLLSAVNQHSARVK